jgi:hypothetical protein
MNSRNLGLALGLLVLLVGCPDETEPPPVNKPPRAAFNVNSSVQAGTPLAFDASPSSDPDMDALAFSWDFGDGQNGGVAKIAHVFAAAGSFKVKLTVSDGKNGLNSLEKTVMVSAAPSPSKTVAVQGLVKSIDDKTLAGVNVAVVGNSVSSTTGADGKVSLNLGVGVDVMLKLSKDGFTDQFKVINLPNNVGTDGYFEASLMPREVAQNLEAASGGNLTGKDGAKISLEAGSLMDSSGKPVLGNVQVSMTPVDVTGAALSAFPGKFEGINPDGSSGSIVSYGTVEFMLSQGGQKVQVAPGKKANVELPIYANTNLDSSSLKSGDTLPLWSLDEKTGAWINEGEGTVVASASSPTGFALKAEVAHFSWWNADKFDDPWDPKPKCINDVPGQYDNIFAQAQICNMIADIDRGLSGSSFRANPPRLPSTQASASVPIGGGVALPIPAGVNVILKGSILNGTWQGKITVNEPKGTSKEVLIPLRPVAVGGTDEAISLPFDQTRSLQTSTANRYTFAGEAGKFLAVRLEQAASTLEGSFKILNPSGTSIASGAFGTQQGTSFTKLLETGTYTIEVVPTANVPGAYRIQIKQLDLVNVNKAASVNLTDGESTSYSFGGFAGMSIQLFALQTDSPGYHGRLSLIDPDGIKVINGDTSYPPILGVTQQLTKDGAYTLELRSVGSAGNYVLASSIVDKPSALTLNTRLDLSDTLGGLGIAKYYSLELTKGDFVKLIAKVPDSVPNNLEVAFNFGLWFNSPLYPFANFNPTSDKFSGDLYKTPSFTSLVGNAALSPVTDSGYHLLKFYSRCLADCADYDTWNFPYSFSVLRPNRVTLGVDTPISSSFSEPYGLEVYNLNITDPGYYLLYFNPTAPKFPLEGFQDFGLSVFAPDLAQEGNAFRDSQQLIVKLPIGNHTLSVNKVYAQAAPYNLSAIRLAPPAALSVPSAAVNGSIDLPAQKRFYSLGRTANQVVKINFNAQGNWSGLIRVYQLPSNGDYANFNFSGLALQSFGGASGQSVSFAYTPPSDGTYVIQVQGVDQLGNPNQTGTYTLNLETP